MHLAQHHFQAQGRYFDDLSTFTLGSLFFRTWGLVRCELDADALANGTVAITHARGMMPDGLPFHFPEDPAPEPLNIAGLFSPVHDSHLVQLTIPPYRVGRPNASLDGEPGQNGVRYLASPVAVPDAVSGMDERAVPLARKNFRLRLDTGEATDDVTLPIARVRRDGRGQFMYDPEYIPPCLQIAGSARLLELTVRLVEMLDAKSATMLSERRGGQRSFAEWAAREVANFWFVHAIHTASAPLRHLMRTRAAHPERLYVEMAKLAGALCTFSLDAHPRDLPAYEHDDLAATFDGLERHIRRHLEIMIPSNTLSVPLSPAEQFFHIGGVPDSRAFAGKALWYLGVRSSASRADIAAAVPRLVKICSAEHIVRLVKEGLAGLSLEYVPSPPSELAPRLDTLYFRATTAGPCWTLMVKTNEAGVYAPAAIPDAELEFTIVLEP